jgi:type I restriction enzyme S subunit
MMTPENWIITTLGEIGTWSSGGTPSRKNLSYYGGDIPWVKTGDLNDSLIHNTPENITKEGLKNSSAKIFPPETLLIAMYGATIGKMGILSTEASTNQACGALLPGGETRHLIPFVFHYLLSERENIRSIAKGGAQPNISQTVLKSYPFPLPPLQEQRRITSKIESLQARSSKAQKALEAIPPLLEKFRQSVLSSAFRGDLTADWRAQNPAIESAEKLLERIRKERRKRWEEAELAKMKAKGQTPKDDNWKKKYKEPEPVDTTDLPELPEGWCWASFEELYFNAQNGISKRNSSTGSPTNVLRLADIENGLISDFNARQIKLTESEIEHYQLKHQDIICIRVNGSNDLVARLVLFNSDTLWTFCDHFIRFRLLLDYVEAGFIAPLFNSEAARNYIQRYMVSSAGQNTISQASLRRLPIPLPPREEQKKISSTIETYYDFVLKIGEIVEKESKRISILDQSILAKAFRGELVPQDPNDEPAAQLLKRIKQEKASLEAGKKQRGKVGRKKVIRKKEATAMAKKKEGRPLVEVLHPHTSGLSPEEPFQENGIHYGVAGK